MYGGYLKEGKRKFTDLGFKSLKEWRLGGDEKTSVGNWFRNLDSLGIEQRQNGEQEKEL